MVREITWPLYRVNAITRTFFVEAPTLSDLYEFVANKAIEGNLIQSVVEINPDGTTPRISVLSTKEYKTILEKLRRKSKRTPVPNIKGTCYWCHKSYPLYDWAGLPEYCPTCGRELTPEKEG